MIYCDDNSCTIAQLYLDGESDVELGKNLENMLHGKNSHQQLSHEQEEMERELKKLLAENKVKIIILFASK